MDQISENSHVKATFMKPKSAFYLQNCTGCDSLGETIAWLLFFCHKLPLERPKK